MSKPVFTMMTGLVASGKSTLATKLAEETNAIVFSSDALREEMFGDVNDQKHNSEVFNELHKRIKKHLKSGKNAIMDSTNLSSKRRKGFLSELKNIKCIKKCIIMATPYEQCLKNNRQRDRVVPEYVIERMYKQWDTPYWFEGFDEIEINYFDNSRDSLNIENWLNEHIDYNQNNPHHELSLGDHCISVGYDLMKEVKRGYASLFLAGLLHDCGKPFVKSFTNSKGEPTEIAHYYSHEHVGAYDTLFFDLYGVADNLDVSILVNLHMRPYYIEKGNKKKLNDKYKKLYGEELYQNVMRLHESDKVAH